MPLIVTAAREVPEAQFVFLGPIAKIDPRDMPQAANLHWLGRKEYHDLPGYIANWDSAWMPFALNEATRFISPTKTPEFLAAGLPVVTAAIADVVSGYEASGVVRITDGTKVARDLRDSLTPRSPTWLRNVDALIAPMSWSATWAAMQELIAVHSHVDGRSGAHPNLNIDQMALANFERVTATHAPTAFARAAE